MSPDYFETLQQEYFEDLYELPTNGGEYSVVQGQLVEELAGELDGQDYRLSDSYAMQVARHLNNGEIEEAENLVETLLEGENQ